MFPPVLLEDLKNQHDAFFNNTSRSVPTPKRKTDWKETLKRHFESSLSEIVQSARKALHNDNFQRTVHIEVEVPGVGNITRYANVFFDIYCRTDLIGGKCAARFGIISTVDAAHLMMPARWYVEEDGNLKEPRLHFNPRYEVGEFQYAEFLNGIDLVIGWDTIQKLKLLDPKDGLVAAGLGFRQLAPSVDGTLHASRLCTFGTDNLSQKLPPGATTQQWWRIGTENGRGCSSTWRRKRYSIATWLSS